MTRITGSGTPNATPQSEPKKAEKVSEQDSSKFSNELGKKKKKADIKDPKLSPDMLFSKDNKGIKKNEVNLDAIAKNGNKDTEKLSEDNKKKHVDQEVSANFQQQTTMTPSIQPVNATNSAQQVDMQTIERAEKIADQIVLQTAKDVKQVNIKFNNQVLPNTEVTVTRENGMVKMEFVTTNPESFNLMNKAESALTDTLNRRFENNVSININLANNSDQQDGRSRNQYQEDLPSDQDE